jgi:UDP-N-acetylmuramoyl-L-alanyl-D-glutamate--2,6-diaminopimelate ligase
VCDLSDLVIITSDNPRTENPSEIIVEIEKGVPASAAKKVMTIENRLHAIRTACKLAESSDVILVAGKGHEKYQEINGVRHPFDDKQILREELG